jgi:hypothetical protein
MFEEELWTLNFWKSIKALLRLFFFR